MLGQVLGGADLFLQGLIVPPGGLGQFSAGDVRAVAIPQNPFPFAVRPRPLTRTHQPAYALHRELHAAPLRAEQAWLQATLTRCSTCNAEGFPPIEALGMWCARQCRPRRVCSSLPLGNGGTL